MKKIKIVHIGWEYERMCVDLGYDFTQDTAMADLVMFTGGADVSPHLYGEKNVASYCDARRDDLEQKIFQECVALKIPMVGICRGGQFLNVMNGGRMWQDVDGHTRPHTLVDIESGCVFTVSSTHHQMMRPSANGEIIASAECVISTKYRSEDGAFERSDVADQDVEVVWYPQTRSLCFQPHPEFSNDECREYFKLLLIRKGLL
jgi:gamma-glutamyl-gamma-aminobutyrate hydrolase PuuD